MNTELEFKIIEEHKQKIIQATNNQALASLVAIEEILKVLVKLMDERLKKTRNKE